MKHLIIFLMLAAVVFGATKTFDADTNNNWSVKENWSDNTLPLEGDDVVIGAGLTCVMDQAIISGSTSATSYTAGTSLASITTDAGGAADGTITASGGTVNSILADEITALGVTLITVADAGSLAITGNINGGSTAGAGAHYTLLNSGTTNLTITGNITGGSVTNARALRNALAGTLTVNGNIVGGANYTVMLLTTTTTVVNGDVTGGSTFLALYAVNAQTVTVSGSISGGAAYTSYGILFLESSGNTLSVGKLIFVSDDAPPIGGIWPTLTYSSITIDGVTIGGSQIGTGRDFR